MNLAQVRMDQAADIFGYVYQHPGCTWADVIAATGIKVAQHVHAEGWIHRYAEARGLAFVYIPPRKVNGQRFQHTGLMVTEELFLCQLDLLHRTRHAVTRMRTAQDGSAMQLLKLSTDPMAQAVVMTVGVMGDTAARQSDLLRTLEDAAEKEMARQTGI